MQVNDISYRFKSCSGYKKQIMYYIDINGRLIYEMCNMKSEITGFDDDGLFHIILLWE